MNARSPRPTKNLTTTERTSDHETLVTRTINAPARIVFEAWTKPELFQRWWIPKSFGITIVSCEMDVRTGGSYRLMLKPRGAKEAMAFFGTYREVTPCSRLVWTNEESPDGAITTVTFDEKNGVTRVVVHDLYPSKEALESSGASGGMAESFDQLDELLAGGGAS